MGAWCDFLTEDEFRRRLGAMAALPPETDEASDAGDLEPRPAVWRPNADEIEAAVAQFRRGIDFRVVEFAKLSDGSRVTLKEDRGFGMTGPPGLWGRLTLDELERDVRTTALSDEQDPEDEPPWEWFAERLGALGVQTSAQELRA